ncbi:15789_t:CDS:2 [Funneliformis caledonium]|uniref:15789_t:CDS:1 n=1 Tax=Funneliformis caledonium TaxID=1117310 RepID=A0A9N9J4X3_9GLOM|nr:15789_t:CDS:2 [Funneliformis caledonium]
MTTEVGDETAKKASSRKRKQTSEETTVERKTNPRPPGTSKKAKTEKTDAGPSLPTSKNFLAHAQELKLVISYPVTDKEEDEHEEDTSKKKFPI